MKKKQQLGTILYGSLTDGFLMRLGAQAQLETIKTGKFVSIAGNRCTFFSLITDLKLEVAHPDIFLFPPSEHEQLLRSIIQERSLYATATLRPLLMLDEHRQKMPVKTIPHHFASVYDVDAADVALIFGDPNDSSKRYFSIGTPLDMVTPVCLDLHAFAERSNGIFGKTGTGKTFLTRLVLAGLIKNNKAVNLVFDMHSEYGLQARKEGAGQAFVKGLKTLFPDKVVIFSLDPASTRRRGSSPDVVVNLTYQSVHVQDIISLQDELNLHATACEAAYLIAAKYKKNWLQELLAHGDEIKEFAAVVGAHPESVAALYRKLKQIERLPFFKPSESLNLDNLAPSKSHDVIQQMMEYLDRGVSVIIEFGNYTSTFCYLLLANIITRHIHELYIEKTERFLGTHRTEDEPKKLMITIEEAHKFLNPQAARQTIFGTIAREMRKYYVSLLIVDQRPSGIDDEVLSQIGTKIVAQLNDEKDISAALTGVPNAPQLRNVLASLDSKKQVLLLGHAVAMPVVIETRSYDEAFYAAMQGFAHKKMDDLVQEMF
jgi:hypothetical protein